MKTTIAITCRTFLEEIPRIQKEIESLVELPPLGEGAEYRDIIVSDSVPFKHVKYKVTDKQEGVAIHVGRTCRFKKAKIDESQYPITLSCVLSPTELPNLYSNLERIAKERPLHNEATYRLMHVAGIPDEMGIVVYDKRDENITLDFKEYDFSFIPTSSPTNTS